MSGPQRRASQTAISISMSKDLLVRIDERASALSLTRSQYIAQLARQDLVKRGELTLHETPPIYNASSPQSHTGSSDKAKVPIPAEIEQFLKDKGQNSALQPPDDKHDPALRTVPPQKTKHRSATKTK